MLTNEVSKSVKAGNERKENKNMNNYHYRHSYRNYTNAVHYGIVEAKTFRKITEIDGVLNKLVDIIKQNGVVTISDYYKLTGGIVVDEDTKYGWTTLLDCHITTTRYGYELRMPNATHLDNDPLQEVYHMLQDVDEDNAYDVAMEAMNHLSKSL